MTPIERRILINQRSIMRALALVVRGVSVASSLARNDRIQELTQDDEETLKLLLKK